MGLRGIILPQTRPSKLRREPGVLICSMATPAVDPIDAFFTLERLAYYRDLHARYPLWCGRWPSNERSKPSAHHWLVQSRLHDEASQSLRRSRIISIRFASTPTADEAPRPQALLEVGNDIEVVEDFEPPIHSAVLGAINYTFARWESGYGPGGSGKPYVTKADFVLENWAWHAKGILDATDPRVFGVMKDPGLTGYALHELRRAYLQTDPKLDTRKKKLKTLEAYWLRVGREIGIIPGVKGGKVCALDDELLAGLFKEGAALVREILEYEPSTNDLAEVRALLPGSEVDAAVSSYRVELAKRDPEEAAARDKADRAKSDARLKVALRATRLRFPMFSAAEIESIQESWLASPRKNRYATLAVERMENRLPITASRIWKRTARYRK